MKIIEDALNDIHKLMYRGELPEEGKVLLILERIYMAGQDDREKDSQYFQSQYVQAEMLLDSIEMALDGKEPSDFALSFPIVRRVWDACYTLNALMSTDS